MKVTYYVATSLDGFIAKENGDVSWLDTMDIDMAETGYDEFFASIDGLVMGGNTYDFVFNYGSWPYGNKLSWVCSNRDLQILDGANLNVVQTPEDVFNEAKSKGVKHLWLVGGGQLASSFLELGFLTHISISKMPIKLGTGIPLFADHELEKLSAKKTEIIQKSGFEQLEITLQAKSIT
ncbi:MAG: dihydrofolate reductase family protein [Spirochaetales bacterium]|nr:dihydrofolate reductase family protein [Spirochaetales bacterium]